MNMILSPPQLILLTPLYSEYNTSVANGVSSDGTVVVGGSSIASGRYNAVQWSMPFNTVSALPMIGSSDTSEALNVSSDGSTSVGFCTDFSVGGPPLPSYWTGNGSTLNALTVATNSYALQMVGNLSGETAPYVLSPTNPGLPSTFNIGLISFWFLVSIQTDVEIVNDGFDVAVSIVIPGSTPNYYQIQISLTDSGEATIFSGTYNATNANAVVATGFHNIMVSFDTTTQIIQVMLDGLLLSAASSTWHSTNAVVGDQISVQGGFNNGDDAYVGDVWISNLATFYDLSTPSNVAKFIDVYGNPVNLGSTGSSPTGSQPPIFLHVTSTASSFATNNGSGGSWSIPEGTLSLISPGPVNSGFAVCCSSDGSIQAGTYGNVQNPMPGAELNIGMPCYWDSSGDLHILQYYQGGSTVNNINSRGVVTSMKDDGSVFYGYVATNGAGQSYTYQAAYWNASDGLIHDLSPITTGDQTWVYCCSSDGTKLGGAEYVGVFPSGNLEPVVWTSGTPALQPGLVSTNIGTVHAFSSDGTVAGGNQYVSSGFQSAPARWRDSLCTELLTLSADTSDVVYGININGTRYVGQVNGSGTVAAYWRY